MPQHQSPPEDAWSRRLRIRSESKSLYEFSDINDPQREAEDGDYGEAQDGANGRLVGVREPPSPRRCTACVWHHKKCDGRIPSCSNCIAVWAVQPETRRVWRCKPAHPSFRLHPLNWLIPKVYRLSVEGDRERAKMSEKQMERIMNRKRAKEARREQLQAGHNAREPSEGTRIKREESEGTNIEKEESDGTHIKREESPWVLFHPPRIQ